MSQDKLHMCPDGTILEDLKGTIPDDVHFTGALHDHDGADNYAIVRYEHEGSAFLVLAIEEVDHAHKVICVIREPPHTSGETLAVMLAMARHTGEYWQDSI